MAKASSGLLLGTGASFNQRFFFQAGVKDVMRHLIKLLNEYIFVWLGSHTPSKITMESTRQAKSAFPFQHLPGNLNACGRGPVASSAKCGTAMSHTRRDEGGRSSRGGGAGVDRSDGVCGPAELQSANGRFQAACFSLPLNRPPDPKYGR